MALCEGHLDSALPQLKREESSPSSEGQESPEKKPKLEKPNGDIYGLNKVPGVLPLSVDYRSPVSHFVPPAVELYAARHKPEANKETSNGPKPESSKPSTPAKRKRGRPRVDKTSPEYLANLAARKQAKEMAAVINNRADTGEKRKRGRPRVDKTSPEYLARKRTRELEALEKKAKREYRRRATGGKPKVRPGGSRAVKTIQGKVRGGPPAAPVRAPRPRLGHGKKMADKRHLARRAVKFVKRKDSAASSSTGDTTPRVKRKYTKRTPSAKKNDSSSSGERAKGKRGRPRKIDTCAPKNPEQPKIRVRSNLMPTSAEPITLDSDDEPDLGSPSQASDSLSLDENLRALRHIHEKYANIDKDEMYGAHLIAANFRKPPLEQGVQDEVLSIRSSEGCASVKELDTRVEKLEDSSNSDSDSSSSGSGSSTSGSSSSSSSGSSSSSDSSDSDSDSGDEARDRADTKSKTNAVEDDRSFSAWSSYSGARTFSGSASNSEDELESITGVGAGPNVAPPPAVGEPPRDDDISESENESADKSFQCHICRKWYSTRVTLKIHRRVHQSKGAGGARTRTRSSERYECDFCSETFSRRDKLWEHKAEAHRGTMTVRCEVCRKCFEDEAELAAHDRNHTADERAGRCSACGATFPRYEQLRRHRACAHGEPSPRLPHACAQCGKRFGHAHSLTRHMHNHAKQLYRCVVCKASFARADQLAQHLNSHLANYKRLKP